MHAVSYARYSFPPSVIQHAVWLYLHSQLSLKDVEDLLAERGPDVSDETIRRWVTKFGTTYAARLKSGRPKPVGGWQLDEMSISIVGRPMILWRAVDAAGEILDILVQRPPRQTRRDKNSSIAPKKAGNEA